jgi:hypothetical protein
MRLGTNWEDKWLLCVPGVLAAVAVGSLEVIEQVGVPNNAVLGKHLLFTIVS